MPKKKAPKIYKNYTDENLDKAVVAVKSGSMSNRKACDTFKVPKNNSFKQGKWRRHRQW